MAERTIAQENAVTALANERIKAKAEALIDATFQDDLTAAGVVHQEAVVAAKEKAATAKSALDAAVEK